MKVHKDTFLSRYQASCLKCRYILSSCLFINQDKTLVDRLLSFCLIFRPREHAFYLLLFLFLWCGIFLHLLCQTKLNKISYESIWIFIQKAQIIKEWLDKKFINIKSIKWTNRQEWLSNSLNSHLYTHMNWLKWRAKQVASQIILFIKHRPLRKSRSLLQVFRKRKRMIWFQIAKNQK